MTNPEELGGCQKLFYIIGPKWNQSNYMKDDDYLEQCVFNVLQAAIFVKPVVNTITIPGISIGDYFNFPPRRCARIMIEACVNWSTLVQTNAIRRIKLMNLKPEDHDAFE